MATGIQLSRRTKLAGSAAVGGGVVGPGGVAIDGLWLEANTQSFANNDPVGTWSGQGGLGDATQGTSSARPVFNTNVVNSLPAVHFDGLAQFMSLPSVMAGAAAGTAFVVVKADLDPNAGTKTGHPLMGWGSANSIALYPYVDGIIYDDWGTSARKTTVNPTPSLAAWHVYEIVSAAGDWRNYLDGALLFSTATNTVGWRTGPQLGAFGGFFFTGHIAEVCAYKSALSAGDRSSVRAALGAKYAIAVS
jgi:large repetitive protein